MSTSAILPVSSIDYGASGATASQQNVFRSVLNQLQQAISGGNLGSTQTFLTAVNELSPSSATSQTSLGAFLSSVASAIGSGSISAAQSALTTYQASASASSASSPPASTASIVADSVPTANAIAEGLILSQIQLSLIASLLGASSAGSVPTDTSATNAINGVSSILSAAYPATNTSSAANNTTTTASPYDTLVQAIQSSLAAGQGTANPALAYLSSTGNFVNLSA